MSLSTDSFPQCPAVIARLPVRPGALNDFLVLGPRGAKAWTPDPAAATTFDCMREANRVATRLPASAGAFSLLLTSLLVRRGDVH